MMKKVLLGVAATAVLSMAFSTNATAREFADIYTECGLGAMIAPNNGPVAAVTNVTWDLGTTAISSNATSADTCAGAKEQTASFIFETYPQLEKDIAQGQGAHLDALIAMSGCPAAAREGLTASLRADLAGTVADTNYTSQSRFEQAGTLHQQLHQHIARHSCTIG
ncbi:DUF3015 family protein [Ectothiorhodospiraceae bacterium 2226]|nr:DUF3015 family protein [Ectothiorhodospiraceae bacterium 2226]